jgi:hypothetical protein
MDPYPKEKPTWAMVKYSAKTQLSSDLWPERNVSVQQKTERPPEAGRPGPMRPAGPKQ